MDTLYSAVVKSHLEASCIWEPEYGKLLAWNTLFERSFLKETKSENNFYALFSNADQIPEDPKKSLWLRYQSGNGMMSETETKNYPLSADSCAFLTVFFPPWHTSFENSASGELLQKISTIIGETFTNHFEFLDGFESINRLLLSEKDVSSIYFYPAQAFERFNLIQPVKARQTESVEYDADALYAEFADNKDSNTFFWSTLQKTFVYPIRENESNGLIGMYFIRFENSSKEKAQQFSTVFNLLTSAYRMLFENLQLTDALRQNMFENTIYSIVNEKISEGVIVTDNQLEIVHINTIASMMFGYDRADVIGHSAEEILICNEGARTLLEKSETEELTTIRYLHRRSSESFPCVIRSTHFDFGSDKRFIIWVIEDVSETEESRQSTEKLAQRAFLGDFASMLAHEIRNPINNMSIWIQNIKDLAQDNVLIADAVRRVEEDCTRISDLITNILAFSKPIALNYEVIESVQYIEQILDKWKLNFTRKNVKVYLNPPDKPLELYCDLRQLEQVFNNLIGNSVDAMGTDGGVIAVKIRETVSNLERRQIVFTLSDNGNGIPAEEIDKIFEPFFTTKSKGNGWGLAISKRIVTSHKGMILAKSFLGGGASFEITLPLRTEN